jgi:hypothetical protein
MDIWRALRYGGTRLGLVAFAVAPVLLSDGARLTSRAEIKSAHETAQLEEAVTPIVTPSRNSPASTNHCGGLRASAIKALS